LINTSLTEESDLKCGETSGVETMNNDDISDSAVINNNVRTVRDRKMSSKLIRSTMQAVRKVEKSHKKSVRKVKKVGKIRSNRPISNAERRSIEAKIPKLRRLAPVITNTPIVKIVPKTTDPLLLSIRSEISTLNQERLKLRAIHYNVETTHIYLVETLQMKVADAMYKDIKSHYEKMALYREDKSLLGIVRLQLAEKSFSALLQTAKKYNVSRIGGWDSIIDRLAPIVHRESCRNYTFRQIGLTDITRTGARNDNSESISKLTKQIMDGEDVQGFETNNSLQMAVIAAVQSSLTKNCATPLDIGRMNITCKFCLAQRFRGEKESFCCQKGSVQLPEIPIPPKSFTDLFEDRHFLEHINSYNNKFALASCQHSGGVQRFQGGPAQFAINGRTNHFIGPLRPSSNEVAQFAQLYFVGEPYEREFQERNLRMDVMHYLEKFMHENNLYVLKLQPFSINNDDKLYISLRTPDFKARALPYHKGTLNLPTTVEIAAFIPENEKQSSNWQQIAFKLKSNGDGRLTRISDIHPSYDPLFYVLLFPYGTDGYHLYIPFVKPEVHPDYYVSNAQTVNQRNNSSRVQRALIDDEAMEDNRPEHILEDDNMNVDDHADEAKTGEEEEPLRRKKSKYVTIREFYCYRLQIRGSIDTINRGGRLFQQYICDMENKRMADHCNWLQKNQDKLRADLYKNVRDQLRNDDVSPSNIGQTIILPSNIPGTVRYQQQKYQDAYALARRYGKPDFFITLTCDPNWPEIKRELRKGETVVDRPDIVTRVFNQKFLELMKRIIEGRMFGVVVYYLWVVEWQKRGLPHGHLLLKLRMNSNLFRNSLYIDAVVSAEIPLESDVEYRKMVLSKMVHGPCGLYNPKCPCMENGKCCKGFPKDFCEETIVGEDSYPMYRRRDDGRTFTTNDGIVMDNRWIVPHNRELLMLWGGHANVEICSSFKSIKYLFKYVHKGPDNAVVGQDGVRNEITEYLMGRYITCSDALYNLFSFKRHAISPNIVRLPIHLPDMQNVIFDENIDRESLSDTTYRPPNTALTGFFKLNCDDPRARLLLYHEIPEFYALKNKSQWSRRKRNVGTVGRIPFISPTQGDIYFLRMLLIEVRGPKSFEELMTFNDTTYQTFFAAAVARGLLKDDEEWEKAMSEAAGFKMPKQLRIFFVLICVFNNPIDPLHLFTKFLNDLGEDIMYREKIKTVNEYVKGEILQDLQKLFTAHGKLLKDYNLPLPPAQNVQTAHIRRRHENVDKNELQQYVEDNLPLCNIEQRPIYEAIMGAVFNTNNDLQDNERLFFINGIAGGGKTWLLTLIINSVRAQGRIAIVSSASGVASLLLPSPSSTSHTAHAIPLSLHEDSTCGIKINTALGDLHRDCSLIVLDEVVTLHKHAISALDRSLQDIMKVKTMFGGKIILATGDFRQTLPVKKHSTPGQIISSTLKYSIYWEKMTKFDLNINMRVQMATCSEDKLIQKSWSNFLIRVGDGIDGDFVKLPEIICLPEQSEISDLCIKVFGDLTDSDNCAPEILSEKAILTPLNKDVTKINDHCLHHMHGEQRTFLSIDAQDDKNKQFSVPLEFLHTLEPSGLPPHVLNLKIGCVVIVVRNIDQSNGLMNGTRLLITGFHARVLEARILTKGSFYSKKVLICKIPLTQVDDTNPFTFTRFQFPVKLAFCMSIHKSQGQTLENCGVYLPEPVFSHGMLYVALGRCGNQSKCTVLMINNTNCAQYEADPGQYAKNVVYKQILNSL